MQKRYLKEKNKREKSTEEIDGKIIRKDAFPEKGKKQENRNEIQKDSGKEKDEERGAVK